MKIPRVGKWLRRTRFGECLPAVRHRSNTLSDGILWMIPVDALHTFPLVACFEEVWVVDDGAGLQVRGT